SLSTALGSAPANTDYIGFGGSTTNLYQSSGSTGNQLTLGSGLASAVALQSASVQVYSSNGAVGATTISVTGLTSKPVANSDYLILNNDIANPYLITAAAGGSGSGYDTNAYVLTISPGLASAVNVNNGTQNVQIFSPYMNYTDDVKRP